MVRYDIREFTVEHYVKKYLDKLDAEKNELYVPDYQREFVWDVKHQSRFIESLVLGLPIPLIFVAENADGRLEIVDGSQRIRTIAAFAQGELTLSGLKKLTTLNGLRIDDLCASRQRKFNNTSMRMIVLSEMASDDVKNEMFDRLNTSGVALMPQEVRRGIYAGEFTKFVTEIADSKAFRELCPQFPYMENRREEEEMVLRFFAYTDTYPRFAFNDADIEKDGVARFLDKYLNWKNTQCSKAEYEEKRKRIQITLSKVKKLFPHRGFAKADGVVGVSKPYFEAIAVGICLALQQNPNAKPQQMGWSVMDKNHQTPLFKTLLGRYKTHTRTRIRERIDLVKNAMLEQ